MPGSLRLFRIVFGMLVIGLLGLFLGLYLGSRSFPIHIQDQGKTPSGLPQPQTPYRTGSPSQGSSGLGQTFNRFLEDTFGQGSSFSYPNTLYLPVILRAPDLFSFISLADTRSGTATLANLSQQAQKYQPALVLYPGDLENNGFTLAGMTTWEAAMDGNSGDGMAAITLPVRGNHDSSDPGGWQDYFNLHTRAEATGAKNFTTLDDDLTYSFDFGNAHFIGVDILQEGKPITAAQVQFIDTDLTAAEARGLQHAFLYFHRPLYPVGAHTTCTKRVCPTDADISSLVEVLNRHTIVSAIFNGHEHLQSYVHIDTSRIPEVTHPFEQFISGAAGAGLYSCDKPYRFDFCKSSSGFAVVQVKSNTFTVSFYLLGQANPVKEYSFQK